MFELPPFELSDSKSQPESDPEPPSLYLVESIHAPDIEPIEYRAGYVHDRLEQAASAEAIAAIARGIKNLTKPSEGVLEKYVFRREKVLPGPFESTVHLNEYGFFGHKNSPAELFHVNEPNPRIAGIEIRFPIAKEGDDQLQLAAETYLIEADQDGISVLHRYIYDEATGTTEVHVVNEKGTVALLALLEYLQNE